MNSRAIDACRACGKSVPEDIGIGRWRLGRLINITTVRQPVADIIGTVIDLIISVVEEPSRAAPPAKRLFGERLDHASIRLFRLGLSAARRTAIAI